MIEVLYVYIHKRRRVSFINGFNHISPEHTGSLLILTNDPFCLKFIYPPYH